MLRSALIVVLLSVVCFSLASHLHPRFARSSHPAVSGSVAFLLGDSRKVIADRIFAKADAYFHQGKYPSIFEINAGETENHMSEARHGEPRDSEEQAIGQSRNDATHEHAHGDEVHNHDHDHDNGEGAAGRGEPRGRDWIEAFGRRLKPAGHSHLAKGDEREMLPWLRLSAEFDPERAEVYAVTAYWLRDRLGNVDAAEEFIREGLKHNPGSPELLYELGRLFFESRRDLNRARNIWKAALRQWEAVEAQKPDENQNKLLKLQIYSGLYVVEVNSRNFAAAIHYLEQLKPVSPFPEEIQKRIEETKQKMLQSGEHPGTPTVR